LRSAISAPLLTISRALQPLLLAALAALAALALAAPAGAASGFYIRGGGNGHGIGMSQYGASGYALHGKDYRWILAHYYQRTSLNTLARAGIVRVLLSTGQAAFSGATRAGHKKLKSGATYAARPNADGSVTLLHPSGKKVGSFKAPLTITGPGPLLLAGHGAYRGALELRADGHGGIETVNAVGLEDYVLGVIAAEMPSSWSAEALKVQAVAARTYAITSDVGAGAFDVYADTRSQMYGGVSAETPATDAAVAATRRQVVTYRGAPVVTYFFASSGGHTESVENVWPGSRPRAWLRGVPDPFDGAGHDPYHRWGRDMTTAAAAARLGTMVKGSLVGIRVTRHGTSPRIITAQVIGTKGRTSVTGAELQRAFGLLTTYAAFTTIRTAPGPLPPARHAILSVLPIIKAIVAATVPSIHGSVFPAPRARARASVEREVSGTWRALRRVQLSHTGSFEAQLPSAGTYRIVFAGIAGPAVHVR
jgi:stage II sporulation protein D